MILVKKNEKDFLFILGKEVTDTSQIEFTSKKKYSDHYSTCMCVSRPWKQNKEKSLKEATSLHRNIKST